jgi:hypothetical protein
MVTCNYTDSEGNSIDVEADTLEDLARDVFLHPDVPERMRVFTEDGIFVGFVFRSGHFCYV